MSDIHIGNPASSVDKVVGTWRWSQTIPHPQKPYPSRWNFDSTCDRNKVRISTYKLGGHLGF